MELVTLSNGERVGLTMREQQIKTRIVDRDVDGFREDGVLFKCF